MLWRLEMSQFINVNPIISFCISCRLGNEYSSILQNQHHPRCDGILASTSNIRPASKSYKGTSLG